jgi:hypothetical protein
MLPQGRDENKNNYITHSFANSHKVLSKTSSEDTVSQEKNSKNNKIFYQKRSLVYFTLKSLNV